VKRLWHAYPIIRDRGNAAICERIGVSVTEEISGDSDDKFLKERWGESPDGCRRE
jgi:hypothetical protein